MDTIVPGDVEWQHRDNIVLISFLPLHSIPPSSTALQLSSVHLHILKINVLFRFQPRIVFPGYREVILTHQVRPACNYRENSKWCKMWKYILLKDRIKTEIFSHHVLIFILSSDNWNWNPPHLLHPPRRKFSVVCLSFSGLSLARELWHRVLTGLTQLTVLSLSSDFNCSDAGVVSQAGRHVERPLQPQHTRLLLLRLAGGLRPSQHQQTQVGLGGGDLMIYWSHSRHSWFSAMYQANKHKNIYQSATAQGRTVLRFYYRNWKYLEIFPLIGLGEGYIGCHLKIL